MASNRVGDNMQKLLKNRKIVGFIKNLNVKLSKCGFIRVEVLNNYRPQGCDSLYYLAFVLFKDNAIVSHILCNEYLIGETYWVGVNSFTDQNNRRQGYNLLLRGVSLAIIDILYKGVPMKIYSSIANQFSLCAWNKYFNVGTYNFSNGKVDSVLLNTKENLSNTKFAITKFITSLLK
jgi:hypothetical protein